MFSNWKNHFEQLLSSKALILAAKPLKILIELLAVVNCSWRHHLNTNNEIGCSSFFHTLVKYIAVNSSKSYLLFKESSQFYQNWSTCLLMPHLKEVCRKLSGMTWQESPDNRGRTQRSDMYVHGYRHLKSEVGTIKLLTTRWLPYLGLQGCLRLIFGLDLDENRNTGKIWSVLK